MTATRYEMQQQLYCRPTRLFSSFNHTPRQRGANIDQAIPLSAGDLAEQLLALDGNNQNGIWARIIKNAFAPLFIETVDYVAGNPPWVNWENLPEDYRNSMKGLWVDYDLFTLSGSAGRLGGGKKDLSMLFVYTAVDNYLQHKGRLGFVITQSVFKTQGAGDGFRQLRYDRQGTTWRLKPLVVHDLSALQVFEGATNRTAVFVCEKTRQPFKYPVKYATWSGPSRIAQDESLAGVLDTTSQTEMGAVPVVPNKESSPWLTAPKKALPGIHKVIGQSDYQAYAGCCTWLNGVFWVRVIEERPDGNLVIENLHDVGKIKVPRVEAVIEPDLVYPLLRGRDVSRWHAEPSCHIILAQDPKLRKGIPEANMKRDLPKTFAYLKQFEGDPNKPMRGTLRGRSGYRQYFKPSDPFYSMYNVGPYTMAKWKVVWNRIDTRLQASIVGVDQMQRLIMMQETHTIAEMGSVEEAFYFSAAFNSAPCDLLVRCYSMGKSFGSPHVMQVLSIPKFDKSYNEHHVLARLGKACHAAADENNEVEMAELESEIDEVAAKIWGITDAELKAIQKALEKD